MAALVYCIQMPSGQTISLYHGDLTQARVDAIVNAANSMLSHGGGVAGAIVRQGGPVIQEESNRLAPVPVGQAVITSAGVLPARHVIHAVGPRWGEGNERAKLRSAALSALRLAELYDLTSIALPAISSGIFGFPKDQCAEILVQAAVDFCAMHPQSRLRDIRFTLIDEPTVAVFCAEFERRWGSRK
ncbi:MAG: macro domain-containing protein [Armatimonadetes bacterium]|nr:macro domain-containing protein [Armatimonadota bacterium]